MIKEVQFTIPVTGLQLDKRERKRLKDKRYYERHKSELNAKSTQYNREHPEQRRATCKRYYENNLEKESVQRGKFQELIKLLKSKTPLSKPRVFDFSVDLRLGKY